ncbi:MAG: hypothetical protein AUI11_01000 [Acidobacteria bacterium 13_2_20CM_2_66_4]|nr:MAG: hypothetical protein AUI11_01000 [Acidobacteria bacterium 13_2_20CM_2_66_4]
MNRITFALLFVSVALLSAQPPQRGQGGGRGGGGPRGAEPLVLDDHTGFEAIFDGTTLKGWDGDPAFWRAENGAIVGQSTEQKPVKQNTFIIWRGKGYQADIDFANQFTGQIYEERGRGFLAMRGQAVYVPDNGRPRVIGNLQQSADELKAIIRTNDWNQVHIVARGNTIIQILNGAVTSIVVDDDSKNRALGGLLGFQMHVGPPMKAEFRNIWLKKL